MYKFLCHIVAILVPARLVMTNRNWQRKAEVGITPILSSDISWSNQIMHRSTRNRYRINVLYFSNLGKYNCYIALNKYINVLYIGFQIGLSKLLNILFVTQRLFFLFWIADKISYNDLIILPPRSRLQKVVAKQHWQ